MSDFIDDEIQREGGATETDDPADAGGRTKYGISEHAHPEAWADGDVSYDEARTIYQKDYVEAQGISKITDTFLMHQVIDFGIPSGPITAVHVLQQLLGVTMDGVVGPATLAAIAAYPNGTLFGIPVPGIVMLNLAFRDARALYYATITKKRPANLKFLLGWIKRSQEFK